MKAQSGTLPPAVGTHDRRLPAVGALDDLDDPARDRQVGRRLRGIVAVALDDPDCAPPELVRQRRVR